MTKRVWFSYGYEDVELQKEKYGKCIANATICRFDHKYYINRTVYKTPSGIRCVKINRCFFPLSMYEMDAKYRVQVWW